MPLLARLRDLTDRFGDATCLALKQVFKLTAPDRAVDLAEALCRAVVGAAEGQRPRLEDLAQAEDLARMDAMLQVVQTDLGELLQLAVRLHDMPNLAEQSLRLQLDSNARLKAAAARLRTMGEQLGRIEAGVA